MNLESASGASDEQDVWSDLESPQKRISRATFEIERLPVEERTTAREELIAKRGFSEAEVAGLDEQLRLDEVVEPGAEAASETKVRETGDMTEAEQAEEMKTWYLEKRERSKQTRNELTAQFGDWKRFPGVPSGGWVDPSDDSIFILGPMGHRLRIAPGGMINFGDSKKPIWKKWTGVATGYVDGSEDELRKTLSKPPDVDPDKYKDAEKGKKKNNNDPLKKRTVPEARTDAAGIYSDPSGEQPVFQKVGNSVMVKIGNKVRFATPEEIAAQEDLARRGRAGFTSPTGPKVKQAPGQPDLRSPAERAVEELQRHLGAGANADIGQLLENLTRRAYEAGKADAGSERGRNVPNASPEFVAAPSSTATVKELPAWAGGYGQSWDRFDPSQYADVKKILTLPEIRGNQRYNQLMGELMVAVDPGRMNLVDKIAHGESLSTDDRLFMNFVQHELSKNIERSAWIEKNLKNSEIELMMSRDERFRAMVTQNGVARTTEAFKNAIYHKANQDKPAFEQFYRSLQKLKDKQLTASAKKAELATQEFCKQFGIQPNRYGDFVDMRSPAGLVESKRRLANHIHEHAGKFRRAIDWIEWHSPVQIYGSSASKSGRAIATMKNYRAPDKFNIFSPRSWMTGDKFGGVEQRRTEAFNYLADTISGPEFRYALEREAFLGEKLVPVTESGPQSMDEVKNSVADRNSPQSIETRIRGLAQSDPNWDSKSYDQKSAAVDNLRKGEAAESKGLSFLAWILNALLNKNWGEAKSKALGPQPAHV